MMNDLELIRITDVDYIKDHIMKLTFSNGDERIVDFLPLLTKKIHEPLKDLGNFIQFGLNHWTLEWYNGAEFAPDYLYSKGKSLQAA
ncbi:MAG: DUF2442 domain-containing protein [Bacteroidaceae bacterium]|nr:DUF2442 domain-containing protein [Bacteroidaceae bacterium]